MKNIFGGVAWSLICNVTNAVYGFLSVPLLLNYYGKEKYGLIGIAISVNIYLRILDMGFSSGNVKFFSSYLVKNDYEGLKKLFQSSLFFYLVIALVNGTILLGLSIFSHDIFHLDTVNDAVFKKLLLILIITSFPVWIGNVMEQLLRSNELIAWQQRILLITKLAQLVVLFITIYFKLSILEFFALNTLCSVINIPFYIVRIKKLSLGISFIPKYYKETMEEVIPYCLSIFSFGIFQFSANYLRPVFLGIKLGLTSVSDFRMIEGIANLILILGSSFVGVILPYATKSKELGDKESEMEIAFDGTRYISIFLALVVFGFVLSSKELIILYVGEKNVYLVFWLNFWIFSLLGLHNSALSSLVLVGNSLRPIVYMSAFSTFVSLTLAWFLMDYFGMGGVIISYGFYVIFQIGYYYIYYYPIKLKYDSFKIFTKSFLYPVFVIGIISLFVRYFFTLYSITNIYILILLKEIIFTLFALVVIYYFLLTKKDTAYINAFFLKFFNQ
ncbi:O-antigen/teichoic acid export membrane protein [Arcicella rosea]|uniref:lipopolysaccharide biosynthesis protein n=1 Tax=Arcicella rosea TaxID=502909 RepID=UPI00345CCC73